MDIKDDGQVMVPNVRVKWYKNRKIVAALVVLLIATFGLVGGLLYANHLNNKPEKVLSDASLNMLDDVINKRPFAYKDSKIKVGFMGVEGSFDFSSVYDKDEGSSGQLEMNMGSIAYGLNINLAGEAMTDSKGEEVFFKLTGLDKLLNNQQFGQFLTPYKSQIDKINDSWIKVTKSDVDDLNSGVDPTKCQQSINDLSLTDEDEDKLTEAYKQNSFVIVKEELDSEEIDGRDSFHYVLSFDSDKAESFINNIKTTEPYKKVYDVCQDYYDKAEASSGSDQYSVNDLNISPDDVRTDLWVDKSSRTPSRIKLSYNEKGVDFTADLVTEFNTALRPNVSKPDQYMSLDEVKKLFGAENFNPEFNPTSNNLELDSVGI